MKNTLHSLIVFAALAGSPTLRADTLMQLPLNQVCNFANGKTVQVTTGSGETVEGTCFAVSVDEIQIQTKKGILTIARSQLSRVRMYDTPPHRHLVNLGKDIRSGLRGSVKMIPTEWGLVGVVGVPATLAWGAIASPFCLLGDAIGYRQAVEIRIK
jgi:hypothetical protein